MRKIQYSVLKNETNSAGGKAKNDAYDIMNSIGFESSYNPSNIRIIRLVQQILSMRKMKGIKVLFIQYPAIEKRMLKFLYQKINKEDISIVLVHDLPSIQGMSDGDKELELYHLKHFNHLVVHNKYMAEYLKSLGYRGEMIYLQLFDYLHDVDRPVTDSPFSNSICFAGNLKKSTFLQNVGGINGCSFNLYGIKGDLDFSGIKNVKYLGCLPSDEIVYLLDGDYGLIWDGDSVNSCSGIYGEYLKYNNPHKLSLYIAAGKPVITWKKAAIADFVVKEGIGYVVDSLEELSTIDLEKDYRVMKNRVMKLKKRVASGEYLKEAIEKILKE